MVEKITENEFVQFFIKILFPAFIGVGIKIAVEMRKEKTKISLFNVCLSMFTGVGGAYIFSGMIQKNVEEQFQSVIVAFVAIITEKIAEFLIYRFNVDAFLTAVLESVFSWISSGFKNKSN